MDAESSLITHARNELEMLGNEESFNESVMGMVRTFSEMGHSGFSASYTIGLLTTLLEFRNLMPLSSNPEEWIHHSEEVYGLKNGIWQNLRNSTAFSTDGGITYTLLADRTTEQKDRFYFTRPYKDGKMSTIEAEAAVRNQGVVGVKHRMLKAAAYQFKDKNAKDVVQFIRDYGSEDELKNSSIKNGGSYIVVSLDNGYLKRMRNTDWVVIEGDGSIRVYTDDEFARYFSVSK